MEIEEIPQIEEDRIKELEVDLVLDEKGYQKYTTGKINGYLKQYIFLKDSISPIRILIFLARFPDLLVFERDIYKITETFLPEMQPQDETGTNLTFGTTKIPINSGLIIEVNGEPSQHVKIIINYE